jgi:hypothetical protein
VTSKTIKVPSANLGTVYRLEWMGTVYRPMGTVYRLEICLEWMGTVYRRPRGTVYRLEWMGTVYRRPNDTIQADFAPTKVLKDASEYSPIKLLRRDWTLLLPFGAPSGMNDT